MNNCIDRRIVQAHMEAAEVYAQLSYCERLKVGSITVKNDNVISHGYNRMPLGEPHTCELDANTTNPRVRHSEINNLRNLAKSSESSVGAIMFVTHAPCPFCAIEIAEAGIAAVFFEHEYRDMSGVHDLLRKGVKVFKWVPAFREIYEYCSFNLTAHLYEHEPIRF